MKKYIPLLLFVVPISFVLGSWWGLYREEQKNLLRLNSNTLNLYCLKGTFPSQFFESYSHQHKLRVRLIEFSSEEALVEAAYQKTTPFDAIVIPSYKAKALMDAQMFAKMNYRNQPEFKKIHADFRSLPFDDNNTFFAPLSWGINGFVVAPKTLSPNGAFSLRDLFSKKETQPRIHLKLSSFELLQNIQKHGNFSINWIKTEKNDLLLSSIQSFLKQVILSEQPPESLLLNKTALVSQIAHGQAAYFLKTNDSFEYHIPTEKATLWLQLLAIRKNSQYLKEARQLLGYIFDHNRYTKLILYNHQASVIAGLKDPQLPAMIQPSYLRSLELSRVHLVSESSEGQEVWKEALSKAAPKLFPSKKL